MGKKRSGVRGSPTQAPAVPEEVTASEASKLRDEGSRMFGRKEYLKALETYDKALKASGEDSTSEDRALLHSNKAACYMMQQKFKEAVGECTNALNLNPNYHRALVRRAKASEQLGLYKKALQDIQKANKTDTANPDTQETEKRLKDIVHGNRKATGGVNGIARKTALQQRAGNRLVVTAKCTLNGEARMVHLMGQLNYAEVLDAVKDKFPGVGPFLVKYQDREGDKVTITDKADVHKAVGDLMEQAERKASQSHGPRLSPPQLPPLQLELVPVSKPEDVPQPPADELLALQELHAARKVLQAQALRESRKRVQQAEAAAQEGAPQMEPAPAELDQWLIDFAGLFRDHLGIEPDRHLDLTQQGWDSLQAGIDGAVRDEKSLPLFQKAFEKFQEVSASGQIQMGNVKLALGKRHIDCAITAEAAPSSRAEAVNTEYKQAEACYRKALALKEDMYDPIISLANLEFERGKLAMDLAIASPTPVTQEQKDADEKAEEKQTSVHMAHVKKGLAQLKAENVEAAEPFFKRTWELVQEALDLLPKEVHGIKLKPPPAEGSPPEDELNPWGHCMVVWGNLLYEHSQFQAAVRKDWRSSLDTAVEKFREAGCPENEIRGALVAHSMKDELDLGPDPAAEKPAAEAANSTANGPATPDQSKDQAAADDAGKDKAPVKGLPDLGKPRKKADKAADKADKQVDGTASQPAEPAAVDQAEGAKV